MQKVLIISRKNEARSQMAEKWLNYYGKNHIQVWSAGVEKGKINLYAQKVMAEAVMDIPNYKSKLLTDLGDIAFDYALCFDNEFATELPELPGNPKLKVFDVPNPVMVEGDDAVKMKAYTVACNAVDDACFVFVQQHFSIV